MELYLMMSLAFGLGGAIITVIAINIHRCIVEKESRATAHAQAKIVEVLFIGNRSTPRYIYEFSTNDASWRIESAGKKHLREGDMVTIHYDPDSPENVYIPEAQPRIATIALHLIGMGWLLVSIMLLILWKLSVK